jgi:hypothetical protein
MSRENERDTQKTKVDGEIFLLIEEILIGKIFPI